MYVEIISNHCTNLQSHQFQYNFNMSRLNASNEILCQQVSKTQTGRQNSFQKTSRVKGKSSEMHYHFLWDCLATTSQMMLSIYFIAFAKLKVKARRILFEGIYSNNNISLNLVWIYHFKLQKSSKSCKTMVIMQTMKATIICQFSLCYLILNSLSINPQ